MGSSNMVSCACLRFFLGAIRNSQEMNELYRSSDTKWRAPKFLIRPKVGLSYLNNGIVMNSRHAPSPQH